MSGSMSGMWKRSHGRTSEAPPERKGRKTDMFVLQQPRHIPTLRYFAAGARVGHGWLTFRLSLSTTAVEQPIPTFGAGPTAGACRTIRDRRVLPQPHHRSLVSEGFERAVQDPGP